MFVVNYHSQDLYFYENPHANVEWEALAGVRGPGEGNMIRYAFERREPLAVQWEAFLLALRNAGEPPVSALRRIRRIVDRARGPAIGRRPRGRRAGVS